MSTRGNKNCVRELYEGYLTALPDSLFSVNYVHAPGLSAGFLGVVEARQRELEEFGDQLSISVHNMLEQRDLVVAEISLIGRGVEQRQINWYRVIDGCLVERWWVEGQSDFTPIHSEQPVVDAATLAANRRVVRRYYGEVFNNPDLADELFPPDYTHYPGLQSGPEGVKDLMRMVAERFGNNASIGLEHLIAEGDLVAADFTLSGQGNRTREMCLFRVAESKIVARSCVYCDPPPGSNFCH